MAETVQKAWVSALESWPEVAVMNPDVTRRILSLRRISLPDPCDDLACLTILGQSIEVPLVLSTRLEKVKRNRVLMTVRLVRVEDAQWGAVTRVELDLKELEKEGSHALRGLAGQLFPAQASQPPEGQPRILEDEETIRQRRSRTPLGMVYIPASVFIMGSEDGERDEREPHLVRLDGFYMDIHEVTNEEYKEFVEATRRRPPACWKDDRLSLPAQPVVGISWEDAHAYAEWRGHRLPSEAEWERAARGLHGQTYPWGEEPPFEQGEYRCNMWGMEDGFEMTAPVGSFPTGVSPEGCMDMAGNVWEWVNSLYRPYPYNPTDGREDRHGKGDRSVRGGCWIHSTVTLFRCSARNSLPPRTEGLQHPYLGFRCAASVEE